MRKILAAKSAIALAICTAMAVPLLTPSPAAAAPLCLAERFDAWVECRDGTMDGGCAFAKQRLWRCTGESVG